MLNHANREPQMVLLFSGEIEQKATAMTERNCGADRPIASSVSSVASC
jgi:hypothetical protein